MIRNIILSVLSENFLKIMKYLSNRTKNIRELLRRMFFIMYWRDKMMNCSRARSELNLERLDTSTQKEKPS